LGSNHESLAAATEIQGKAVAMEEEINKPIRERKKLLDDIAEKATRSDDPYQGRRNDAEKAAKEAREKIDADAGLSDQQRADAKLNIEVGLWKEIGKIADDELKSNQDAFEKSLKDAERTADEGDKYFREKAEKRKQFMEQVEKEIFDATHSAEEAQFEEIERKYRERMDAAEGDADQIAAADEARTAVHEKQLKDLEQQIRQAEDKPLRFTGIEDAWKQISETANTKNLEREKIDLMRDQRDLLRKLLDEALKGKPAPAAVV
jgi:hypothetical protein